MHADHREDDDRIEVQLVAFGRNRRRWVVDYRVIPHHISDEAGRAALNALLKQEWRTMLGLRVAIDILAIDGGAYTDDVWSWARPHPWGRVIIVKGGSQENGPLMALQKFDRRKDGKVKRAQKRAFNLNVSIEDNVDSELRTDYSYGDDFWSLVERAGSREVPLECD